MRVGLVVTGGVDRSGRERVIPAILALIERLAVRHDLHVFALHHELRPCTYPLLGATVHDLGRVAQPRGFRMPRQIHRLLAAMRTIGRFDLLHAYWALPAGLVATSVARRLGIPSVVTADSGEWTSLPALGYGLQRRWMDRRRVARTMREAARVTVCTRFMQALAAAHGVSADVIPIGVPRPAAGAPSRASGPPWRLLHVASLNPVKDHATLLRAFTRIVRAEPSARLDVVGGDTMNGEIQRAARAMHLDGLVTFHGVQPADVVAGFFERAHLHLVSSRHEAAGVVTLEAASGGAATAGTRVGYLADWADTGMAAVVSVGDADALADAAIALLRNPDRRAAVAAAAGAWVRDHDADWTAGAFDALYRELA